MSTVEISAAAARRFVLGRHGLWPGRRWSGQVGVARAIRASESIQIDTISVVARSHDITLWSRVADYRPDYLDGLLYRDRAFFDYGSVLMIYPSDEMAAWSAVMSRRAAAHGPARLESDVARFVLDEIMSRGPLSSRDFPERARIPGGFNTMKDTGLALYRLWMSGKLVTHSRRGFDRVYALPHQIADRIVPEELPIEDAEARLFDKTLRDLGLASPSEFARRASVLVHRRVGAAEGRAWMKSQAAAGRVIGVVTEGSRAHRYIPAASVQQLCEVAAGQIPQEWRTPGPTAAGEANIIAPLDNVIWDRMRTADLFGFEYVWEVYKPAAKRKWGYYTLPILVGDTLVGRLAPRLDRRDKVLAIEGLWLETTTHIDEALLEALSRGISRFARFHEAESVRFDRCDPLELANKLNIDLDIDLALPVS